jgi:hypothetical protein
MRRKTTIAVTLLMTLVGCDDAVDVVEEGSLEVTAVFSAEALDDDGFTAVIDGGESLAVTPDDPATFTLDVGAHSVELTDIDERCTVDGDNPRDVTVEADATASTEFSLTCSDQ